LAAVAIPKLAATRDDAKISKEIANLKTCVGDVGAGYTATGSEATIGTSAACIAINTSDCFVVDNNGTDTDGNVTAGSGSVSETWCVDARTVAGNQGLTGADGADFGHKFGGSQIVR